LKKHKYTHCRVLLVTTKFRQKFYRTAIIRDTFNIKKTALLLVGASTLPELFDSIITQYKLCLNFFHLEDAGCVVARGVKDKGDIKNTNALNEACELGRFV
jgi:hypothetical protein